MFVSNRQKNHFWQVFNQSLELFKKGWFSLAGIAAIFYIPYFIIAYIFNMEEGITQAIVLNYSVKTLFAVEWVILGFYFIYFIIFGLAIFKFTKSLEQNKPLTSLAAYRQVFSGKKTNTEANRTSFFKIMRSYFLPFAGYILGVGFFFLAVFFPLMIMLDYAIEVFHSQQYFFLSVFTHFLKVFILANLNLFLMVFFYKTYNDFKNRLSQSISTL